MKVWSGLNAPLREYLVPLTTARKGIFKASTRGDSIFGHASKAGFVTSNSNVKGMQTRRVSHKSVKGKMLLTFAPPFEGSFATFNSTVLLHWNQTMVRIPSVHVNGFPFNARAVFVPKLVVAFIVKEFASRFQLVLTA